MTEDQIISVFIRAAEVDRKLPDTIPLTFAQVSKVLRCDARSGKLFWKKRPLKMFKCGSAFAIWNKKHAGSEAFTCQDENGYWCGGIFGKKYRAHRVIWLLHHRKWPDDVIDHINGDPSDNRICNLRDVTQAVNSTNRVGQRTSTARGGLL